MSLQPIQGFKPLKTHHCVTGSMRHIYEFYQYAISEDLLLGLGAGVGFIYWHMKGTQPMYGGRANVGRPGEEGLEKLAGRRTGVVIESFSTGSAKKAEQALIDLVVKGEPVMLQVDMGFLPYFNFPEEFHFGGHVIAIAGYDKESESVLVADREGVLYPVPLPDLAKARGSTFKPFPPKNTWFTFNFYNKRPPQPDEVQQAISEVVKGMLHPPIANLGVKGILTAASRTREWDKIMDDKDLRSACFNIFIFIDATGGTGGGIFRYMYGRFLREAAEITDNKQLATIGDNLYSIGDQWQEVAQIFKEASSATDPRPFIQTATSKMITIADNERMIWEQLEKAITI
jgi:hypothetical protein